MPADVERERDQGWVERVVHRIDAVRNFGGMTILLGFGIVALTMDDIAATVFGLVIVLLYVAYLASIVIRHHRSLN